MPTKPPNPSSWQLMKQLASCTSKHLYPDVASFYHLGICNQDVIRRAESRTGRGRRRPSGRKGRGHRRGGRRSPISSQCRSPISSKCRSRCARILSDVSNGWYSGLLCGRWHCSTAGFLRIGAELGRMMVISRIPFWSHLFSLAEFEFRRTLPDPFHGVVALEGKEEKVMIT